MHQRNVAKDVKLVAHMGAHLSDNQRLARHFYERSNLSAGEAIHWATGKLFRREDAAYLNGVDAATLDYDPVHAEAVLHADIVVLPAIYAVAEQIKIEDQDFRFAHILGSEFACRLACATSRKTDWFESSVFGVYGAVLACGILRKWSPEKIEKAMGLALGMCAGTKAVAYQSVSAKRMLTANAARAAVEAVSLVDLGFCGPADALFGRAGLSKLYDDIDYNKCLPPTEGMFVFANTRLKPYPACLMCHEPIRCAAEIHLKLNKLDIADIKRILVTAPEPVFRIAGSSASPEGNLVSVSAMFSISYAISRAILSGGFSIKDILDTSLTDTAVAALISRMNFLEVEDSESDYLPVKIEVEMESGRLEKVASNNSDLLARADDLDEALIVRKAKELEYIRSGRLGFPRLD
jgi:2-methylcitrate dehydratase PrpD